MPNPKKIAFLLEEFTGQPRGPHIPGAAGPSSFPPGQHLLDRFLTGYPRDGELHRPPFETVTAYVPPTLLEPDFERRKKFGLVIASKVADAVQDADAVVIVPRQPGAVANDRFLQITLEKAPPGSACFVYGALTNSLAAGQEMVRAARARRIALLAGTPMPVTWRLPQVDLTPGTPLNEALMVAQLNPLPIQATPPSLPAEVAGGALLGLDGLFPVIERRRGGESGIRSVRFLEGEELWRAGQKGMWPWSLMAPAISRSQTPQGDPVLDGRTQDIVGLGLAPKLARAPRGWILEHRDGLRSAVLLLDGVVADFNFAVRSPDGTTVSAQLLRAPPPAEHQFSLLAAAVEQFLVSGKPPWPIERSLLIAGLLEVFAKPIIRSGRPVETPNLNVPYQV